MCDNWRVIKLVQFSQYRQYVHQSLLENSTYFWMHIYVYFGSRSFWLLHLIVHNLELTIRCGAGTIDRPLMWTQFEATNNSPPTNDRSTFCVDTVHHLFCGHFLGWLPLPKRVTWAQLPFCFSSFECTLSRMQSVPIKEALIFHFTYYLSTKYEPRKLSICRQPNTIYLIILEIFKVQFTIFVIWNTYSLLMVFVHVDCS